MPIEILMSQACFLTFNAHSSGIFPHFSTSSRIIFFSCPSPVSGAAPNFAPPPIGLTTFCLIISTVFMRNLRKLSAHLSDFSCAPESPLKTSMRLLNLKRSYESPPSAERSLAPGISFRRVLQRDIIWLWRFRRSCAKSISMAKLVGFVYERACFMFKLFQR